MSKPASILIAICSLLLLCACSGTKNLTKAQLNMPSYFMPGLSTDSASIADLSWWEFYSDSTLRVIMERTLANNHDLLKAAAKVTEMRHMLGIDKANLLPTIDGNVYASNESNDYSGSGNVNDPEHGLKLQIAWEMNLLGALQKAKKRGTERYVATVDDYRAMRMTLVAEVAEAYFSLLALDNELDIVRQTMRTREESLRMAKLRFEGGLTSETVYQQAKVEYATASSLIPSLEQRITSARNALTLLMGEYPDPYLKRGRFALNDALPDSLKVGVPSSILQRRPDLRASEHRLKAAMADVGVTYANRFPSFRINFTPGWENNEFSNFFKSPFTYIIGAVAGPVFDFGRRKHRYQASIAAYDQARLDYEKTVMTAFTEVNTAMTAYQSVRQNRALKNDLLLAAAKYVQLAEVQYRGGTLNYLDVLDAQRRYFDAQIGVNAAIRDEFLSIINLYKALGGGWEI